MTEKVLHYIWKNRLYSRLLFYESVSRKSIVEGDVLQIGKYNIHAGPDFCEAKLCVGKLILAGNVEIHRKASEWITHKHHEDPAYDNVILHVVLEADQDIPHRITGKPILTAEMICSSQTLQEVEKELEKEHDLSSLDSDLAPNTQSSSVAFSFSESNLAVRDTIQHTKDLQPPYSKPHIAPKEPAISFLERAPQLFLERLHEKAEGLKTIYEENRGDLSETLYHLLLRHLGAHVNNDAFAQVARSLPLRIVRKHTDNTEALEALYLGQAALLAPKAVDTYMEALQERYTFLATKYQLTPVKEGCVRMLRLRPPAFPHRRLAILSALRQHYPLLESLLLESNDIKELHEKLATPPSSYWQHHYSFSSTSKNVLKGLSFESINVLIINVVLPYRYFVQRHKNEEKKNLSLILELASQLPSENNRFTRAAKLEGIVTQNALQSQALLQLYKNL